MSEQTFHKGDWVRVADDLGPCMRHFTSGCEAIVIGSYADQYGGGPRERQQYTLHLKGEGTCSWYYENQLTLIEKDRADLLAEWEREEAKADALHSDLDWVFQHGDEVLKSASAATVAALAGCGVAQLWGARGEGIDYYANCLAVLEHAAPFLRAGDKVGWLEYRNGRKP